MTVLVLPVLCLLVVLLTACSREREPAVKIEKSEPVVTRISSLPEKTPNSAVKGSVSWKFPVSVSARCVTDTSIPAGESWTVLGKLTKIQAKLGLDIKVCDSSATANDEQKVFGCQQVLKSIYASADQEATKIADSMLGRDFQGSGESLESAQADLEKKAEQEFSRLYEERVANRARLTSRAIEQTGNKKRDGATTIVSGTSTGKSSQQAPFTSAQTTLGAADASPDRLKPDANVK